LKARRRIRVKIIVYAESIAIACASFGRSGKVSVFVGFERLKCLALVFRCAVFQDQVNAPGLWRPDPEVGLVRPD
jgi:hypothetical protein